MNHLCVNVQAPVMATIAAVPEGLSSSGGRVIWKDGDDHVHIFASFGNDPWYAVYLNTNTGLSYLIEGTARSGHRSPCYDPVSNKLFGGTEYGNGGALWMFDPLTQSLASLLSPVNGIIGATHRGGDNKIYWSVIGNRFYSYDPASPETPVKDYGMPNGGTGLDAGSNYIQMMVDSTHLYVTCKLSGVNEYKVYQTPITGDVAWTEWENGHCFGQYVSTVRTPSPNFYYCLTQVLVDGSIKYWKPSAGSWTEYGSNPGQESDLALVSPFCYMSDYLSLWPARMGYEANFDDLIPLKDLSETTQFAWRVAEGEWQDTDSHAYPGAWSQQLTQDMVPLSGTEMLCISSGYGPMFKVDYDAPLLTYLGPQCFSPYSMMKHSSGEIYIGGYSSVVARYNPAAAYDLTTGDATPRLPGEGNPNPYFILMSRVDGEVLHYRHGLDYDANGLVWIGANTTRKSVDWGDVMWYDPDDGAYGYLFPAWKEAVKFQCLCAASNRSLICVSDSVGNIWIITASTQSVDPVPIRPTVEDSKTYMIEIAENLIFGIVFVGGAYKSLLFNPVTKVIQSLQDITILGIPFGFPDGQYSRMDYRLILGPDDSPWLFIGNSLFEYNLSSASFQKVGDFAYQKMQLAANGTDVITCSNGNTIRKLNMTTAERCHYWKGQPVSDLRMSRVR